MRKAVKRMRLNRETLRLLDRSELGVVAGGVTGSLNPSACAPASNCFSCDGSCRPTCIFGDTCKVTCTG
jgi:hypothetical protein